ncbi:hypothetical protein F7725_000296 [Dissostichus mawsoni]|uniref:Uncharacterized protein n=1 Tax=Dissostichus mawsoni TaxID=36200 RepID=A0A7J5ZFV6_DISMA|nr:hypothetical protein F7725_000296 [Dissostichus mawsoni]
MRKMRLMYAKSTPDKILLREFHCVPKLSEWNLQNDDLKGFGLRVCESLQLNSSSFIEMENNREQLAVSSSDVPSEGCKVHEFMIQLLKKQVQDGKLELERSLRRKKEEKMQEQASQMEEEDLKEEKEEKMQDQVSQTEEEDLKEEKEKEEKTQEQALRRRRKT